ncbi:hypothetical protein [Streptomyces hyaluromycini]|uniref:hypothetical protein n=1 Tax=Streptomyces hyaluromycini TaxID=1377993 RepID=UPI0012381095|nr:hypothetical protein [Streptomyces hyaluromycini]
MTTPYSTTTPPVPARFLLLGDSHAGCVGRAAQQAGLPFVGGPVGSGRDFLGPFLDVDGGGDGGDGGGDLVFRDAETGRLVREFLDELGATGFAGLGVPLVCTFGLSAHTVATRQNWDIHRDRHGTVPEGFLSSGLFGDLVRASVRGALAFYDRTAALGLRVLALMPPQRVPGMSDPEVFFAAQDVVGAELTARGVELVDLRARVTDGAGQQRPAFCQADDTIHGNLAFGRLVLAELLDRGL